MSIQSTWQRPCDGTGHPTWDLASQALNLARQPSKVMALACPLCRGWHVLPRSLAHPLPEVTHGA